MHRVPFSMSSSPSLLLLLRLPTRRRLMLLTMTMLISSQQMNVMMLQLQVHQLLMPLSVLLPLHHNHHQGQQHQHRPVAVTTGVAAAAKWYAQICPTGRAEAVRIDAETGRLVFIVANDDDDNGGGGGGAGLFQNETGDATTAGDDEDNNNNNNGVLASTDNNNNNNNNNGTDPATTTNDDDNGSRRDRTRQRGRRHLRRGAVTAVTATAGGSSNIEDLLFASSQQQQQQQQLQQQQQQQQQQQLLFGLSQMEVHPAFTAAVPVVKTSLSPGGENNVDDDSGGGVVMDAAASAEHARRVLDSSAVTSSTNGNDDDEVFYVRACMCYVPEVNLPVNVNTSSSDGTADVVQYLCHSSASYCGVPPDHKNSTTPVQCYSVDMQQVVARNAWPLILLWYFGLLLICFCTVHGHTASEYVKSRFCCLLFGGRARNERAVRRLMGEDGSVIEQPVVVSESFLSWRNQQRRFEQTLMLQVQWMWRHEEDYVRELRRRERGLPPPQLELKVKRYTANVVGGKAMGDEPEVLSATTQSTFLTTAAVQAKPSSPDSMLDIPPPYDDGEANVNTAKVDVVVMDASNAINAAAACQVDDDDDDDDDDDCNSLDEPSCTICFGPLEEGDRIGDLQCNHQFHVHCLKTWMQRKNACPLCNVRLATRIQQQQQRPLALAGDNGDNDQDGERNATPRRLSRRSRRNRSGRASSGDNASPHPSPRETPINGGGSGNIPDGP